MKTFSIFPFNESDISKVDNRLIPFLTNWKAIQTYKGKSVIIPGTWDSHFTILNYFQVIKKPDSPNPGEDENEIGMTILGGWFPYDVEIIINLRISGTDVSDGTKRVSAEILKSAGSPIRLYHDGKFLTDFTERKFWWKVHKDKIWIDNLLVT